MKLIEIQLISKSTSLAVHFLFLDTERLKRTEKAQINCLRARVFRREILQSLRLLTNDARVLTMRDSCRKIGAAQRGDVMCH